MGFQQNINNNYYKGIECRLLTDKYFDYALYKGGVVGLSNTGLCLSSLIDFNDMNTYTNDNGVISTRRWDGAISDGLLLEKFGFTAIDNGKIVYDKDSITDNEFYDILTGSSLSLSKDDTFLKLYPVSGNTKKYDYSYEYSNDDSDNFVSLKGGFLQGFFKTAEDGYQVFPNYIDEDWHFEFVIRPRSDYEEKDNTLNSTHDNKNKGTFFYIGTRSEDKFAHIKNNWEIYSSYTLYDVVILNKRHPIYHQYQHWVDIVSKINNFYNINYDRVKLLSKDNLYYSLFNNSSEFLSSDNLLYELFNELIDFLSEKNISYDQLESSNAEFLSTQNQLYIQFQEYIELVSNFEAFCDIIEENGFLSNIRYYYKQKQEIIKFISNYFLIQKKRENATILSDVNLFQTFVEDFKLLSLPSVVQYKTEGIEFVSKGHMRWAKGGIDAFSLQETDMPSVQMSVKKSILRPINQNNVNPIAYEIKVPEIEENARSNPFVENDDNGPTITTNKLLSTEDFFKDENQYEVETDNKYLFFNRTKTGSTVENWNNENEGKEILIFDKKKEYIDNSFSLFNRTKTGVTVDDVLNKKTDKEIFTEETQKINIEEDIINNAFALKYNDDGSISYKYSVKDCDSEDKVTTIEETTDDGIVFSDTWNVIHVRFTILNHGKDACGRPLNIGKRKMKVMIYVNGFLALVSKELPELYLHELNTKAEWQQGVPFNISLGGGTQGLAEMIWMNYKNPEPPLSVLESEYAGTFIGDIRSFKFYDCMKQYLDIYNSYKNEIVDNKSTISTQYIYYGFGTTEMDVINKGKKLQSSSDYIYLFTDTSINDNECFYIIVPESTNGKKPSTFTMGGAPVVIEETSKTIGGLKCYVYHTPFIYASNTTLNINTFNI